VPQGLKRYYGGGDAHFITCSCYRRQPWLGSELRRDLFLSILEDTRKRYRFVVLGYIVMPDHFHLLISEPQVGDPSKVLQVIKQRFAQRVLARPRRKPGAEPTLRQTLHVWEPRFYDFNVWSEHKRVEKLRYMHRNPVKCGLVEEPEEWAWSSFRDYLYGETGRVRVNDISVMTMLVRPPAA
jgi:putative transposase